MFLIQLFGNFQNHHLHLTFTRYGAIKGDTTGFGMSLTDNEVVKISPTEPISQNFLFTNRTGAAISYNDFNVFQLFTLSNNLLIGRAEIPNGIPISPPGTSASATVVTSRPLVTPAPTSVAPASRTTSVSRTAAPSNSPTSASISVHQGLLTLTFIVFGFLL